MQKVINGGAMQPPALELKFKVFSSRDPIKLQEEVTDWMKREPNAIWRTGQPFAIMGMQSSTAYVEDHSGDGRINGYLQYTTFILHH